QQPLPLFVTHARGVAGAAEGLLLHLGDLEREVALGPRLVLGDQLRRRPARPPHRRHHDLHGWIFLPGITRNSSAKLHRAAGDCKDGSRFRVTGANEFTVTTTRSPPSRTTSFGVNVVTVRGTGVDHRIPPNW